MHIEIILEMSEEFSLSSSLKYELNFPHSYYVTNAQTPIVTKYKLSCDIDINSTAAEHDRKRNDYKGKLRL